MLVDLHVHLRGTLLRDTVISLAKRNNVSIPASVISASRYGWHDFPSFLKSYDLITSVVKSANDLEQVAASYLQRCSMLGGSYVEFMLSPPDLARTGVPFFDQLRALQAAADQASQEWGVHSRLIATAVRHLGPSAAIEAARMATSMRSDILVGFGLTGDENQHSVGDFAEAFRIARSEGLKATAHAGEHCPAETVIEAIEILNLDRVGHGVRAAESPNVMRQIASARIPLEVCLSSNLALGLYPTIAAHPIGRLANAGCVIALGTDDPSFFDTDLSQEYALAQTAGSHLSNHIINKNAIEAAFCDERTKAALAARLNK
ncbi:adenosine deaminase [Acetobacter fabarum]|uniref:Adenosine deaminase n=1 Tax=Acetobacter fabarum TaxID=483199 RepID=A0A269XWF0_9PROT|nr:adenosine deaminase [Acetobacter fabarum]PAK77637.1 adenosine deaminase [Acetobacter fabarum]PEN23287.1 adenosine deaminase [Acetobacter fabarum]